MIGKESSLLATNLRLRTDVWLNVLVTYEVNVCMCTNSHTLVRMHVTEYRRSAGITPASLATHHCGPATCKFQSSISAEALFCRLLSVESPSLTPGMVCPRLTRHYQWVTFMVYHIGAAVARTILGRSNRETGHKTEWTPARGILGRMCCVFYT